MIIFILGIGNFTYKSIWFIISQSYTQKIYTDAAIMCLLYPIQPNLWFTAEW